MAKRRKNTASKELNGCLNNYMINLIIIILILGILVMAGQEVISGPPIGWGIVILSLIIIVAYTNDRNVKRVRLAQIHELEQLKGMDPVEFENFVATIFRKMGYTVEVTAKVGDEGVDLVVKANWIGIGVVQCKRYRGNVGQPVVRDLYGAMMHNRADEAFLITTGQISLPARTWAKGKPIHLIDGTTLIEWVNRLQQPSSKYSTQALGSTLMKYINKLKRRRLQELNSAIHPSSFPKRESTVPQDNTSEEKNSLLQLWQDVESETQVSQNKVSSDKKSLLELWQDSERQIPHNKTGKRTN